MNVEKRKAYLKEYRARPEVKERIKLANKKSKDIHKAKYYAYTKEWKKENKHIVNEGLMRRYATQKTSCLDFKQYKNEIQKIYKTCSDIESKTNQKHNVDHIVPLIHANVCGLHVPWNLQILTKEENMKKSNQFDGTNNNDSWRLECK